MGKKLSFNESIKNISAVQEYRENYGSSGDMLVIVQENHKTIFHGTIKVHILNYNNYFTVGIIWEDKEPNYHDIGLFGYYSTDYCEMKYSNGVLTIMSGDITITITR